jgi:hypothetical protein
MVCNEVETTMNASMLRALGCAALGFGLIQTAPGLVFAQETTSPPAPPPPPMSAPGPDSGRHWGHGPMMHGAWSPESRHLKAIHDILGITPDQEAAFQAYASALHPQRPSPGGTAPGPAESDRPDQKAMAAMTTPERLDLMAKRMDAREARMRAHFARVAEATKTFYASLSPEQKRIMDSLPELVHGEGHGWEHKGGMGHMHGGPGPMGAPPPTPSGA